MKAIAEKGIGKTRFRQHRNRVDGSQRHEVEFARGSDPSGRITIEMLPLGFR